MDPDDDDKLDAVFSLAGPKKPVEEQTFPGTRPLRQLAEAKKPATPVDEEWDTNPTVKLLHGVETEFFQIGHLAAALGRSTVTVRSWETKGWLPLSQYRTPPPQREMVPGTVPMGRRLYTRAQVGVVIEAAYDNGIMTDPIRKNADWKGFRRAVLAGWKTLS